MNKLNFEKNPFGVHKKMVCHSDRISEYLKTGDTFPIIVEINLTDVCNLNCSYCFCDHRANFTLDKVVVENFIKEFKFLGGKAITFSGGGEPTRHKQFEEIVRFAYSQGLELGLITNGVFDEKLIEVIGGCFKWVRVSLDVATPELYKKIKGADRLKDVLNNISLLKTYKCKLGANCNVTTDMTVDDVDDLYDAVIDDVDYIQFRPVLPRFTHDEKIESNVAVWDHLRQINNEKVILSYDKFVDLVDSDNKNFPFTSCEGHFFSPILDSNGDLKVCMYHPSDENFKFGNIYTNSVYEIWNSRQRQNVIKYVRNFDYYGKCQMCCKLFEINKFIDFVKNPDSNLDVNFL